MGESLTKAERLLAILDHLVEIHQLSGRQEARRLIKELQDAKTRKLCFKPGLKTNRIRNENAKREVLSQDGSVLNPEMRTFHVPHDGWVAPDPVDEPRVDPFDPISLAMRTRDKPKGRSNRTIHRVGSDKSAKHRDSAVKGRREYVKRGNSRKRTTPVPGSQSELVYQALERNNWSTTDAANELQKISPFKEKSRPHLLAQCGNVRSRYHPDHTKPLIKPS